MLALLVTAAVLKPSPKGLGTHQQLGLPPCTVRVMFGVPCPSCGMTTSWSHAIRGELFAAAEANTGGLMLAALAALSGPWFTGSAVRGRWLVTIPNPWHYTFVIFVTTIVTVVQWSVRLWYP